MISGKTPKVLVHTAHDIDGTPLVTTLVGGWNNALDYIFKQGISTERFDFHINPWGLVEAEIPIHHKTLTDLAQEHPRKTVVATVCDSVINDRHLNIVFHSLSHELKNINIFLGNLTEKDCEVFDNCACGSAHYSKCLCLASLALNEMLGTPHDTDPDSEE